VDEKALKALDINHRLSCAMHHRFTHYATSNSQPSSLWQWGQCDKS